MQTALQGSWHTWRSPLTPLLTLTYIGGRGWFYTHSDRCIGLTSGLSAVRCKHSGGSASAPLLPQTLGTAACPLPLKEHSCLYTHPHSSDWHCIGLIGGQARHQRSFGPRYGITSGSGSCKHCHFFSWKAKIIFFLFKSISSLVYIFFLIIHWGRFR